MTNKNIKIELIKDGKIKKGSVLMLNKSDNMIWSFKVKIINLYEIDDNIVLKLKTFKDYPFGHKIIYRNLTELI